jgi:hypothetical protein
VACANAGATALPSRFPARPSAPSAADCSISWRRVTRCPRPDPQVLPVQVLMFHPRLRFQATPPVSAHRRHGPRRCRKMLRSSASRPTLSIRAYEGAKTAATATRDVSTAATRPKDVLHSRSSPNGSPATYFNAPGNSIPAKSDRSPSAAAIPAPRSDGTAATSA